MRAKKLTLYVLIGLLFFNATIFLQKAVQKAEGKPLWMDEKITLGDDLIHGEDAGLRNYSFAHILFKGAPKQGSPSPLDYLGVKFLDQHKNKLNIFGLSDNVYYRINAIGFTFLASLIIAFLYLYHLFKNTTSTVSMFISGVLVCVALQIYYYHPQLMHYTVEMRPYSLWTALWFLILSAFMLMGLNRWIFLLFIILSLTSTAAIFQMFMLGLVYLVINVLYKEGFRVHFKKCVRYFAIPMVICLYYISMNTDTWWYTTFDKYRLEFFHFWKKEVIVGLTALAAIALTIGIKEYKKSCIVFITVFLLYMISPILNELTLLNGFFFANRQYLYYYLVYPLFLLNLILMISDQRPIEIKYKFLRFIFVLGFLSAAGFTYYQNAIVDKSKMLQNLSPVSYDELVDVSMNSQALNEGDLDSYTNYYKAIVKYMPYMSEGYSQLGFIAAKKRDWKVAESYYKKAKIISPRFFWSYYNLGLLYFHQKRWDESLREFEQGLELELKVTLDEIFKSKNIYRPIMNNLYQRHTIAVDQQLNDAVEDVYLLSALIKFKRQDYQSVLEICNGAIRSKFKHQKYFYYYLGRSLLAMGRFEQSINIFLEAVKMDAQFDQAKYYMAEAFRNIGNEAAAEKILIGVTDDSLSKSPEDIIAERMTFKPF